ncbi:hypothetical protein PHJA_000675700 [Phtheirospermum japonicum]|uniref:DUF4378 domain-containing protein n=1 Tax=Phtheirospermum japonicum TaxID=374723 RepID=A0A830BCH2_9LAMI|nr:hypothetical protein PHJA_000675700 [Phtheirospermum japonicum]
MNSTLEKTSSSSLAVVEKKAQRAGGCVGIFFQLFDWNRRFAMKKLFSKKLLTPVRLKQSSKKFGGDEKQPKLRLIADENSGGFPITKHNVDTKQRQEMRAPGLVARLMGLDSMPALQRDKSKKAQIASNYLHSKDDKFVDNVNIYSGDEPNAEKGTTKHELRPQKLQKTSVSERQPITKSGPEKLPPFKNVLSKSRKNQRHPKLPSPVKSPRNISRKNSSKLIGAATRILEPSSRPKCALTYTNAFHRPSHNTSLEEGGHQLEDSDGFAHSSCRYCGYRADNFDSKPVFVSEKNPLIFSSPFASCVGSSCQGLEKSKPGNSVFYQEELHKNLTSHVKFTSHKSPFSRPVPRNSSNHSMSSRSALSSDHKTQIQTQSTRLRLPARMENGKFEPEKRIPNGLNDDSVPPGRKRRPANFINRQERTVENGRVENKVVSFTFNSPVKQKSGIQEAAERRAFGENGGRAKTEKPFPLSGDTLGLLLQQKLKELTCEGEDNIGGDAFRKTTSTILQELICALTLEKQFQQDNLPVAISDRKNSWRNSTSSQANAMASKLSIEQPVDNERPSPGSVLEAYFSTESCNSSSLDESLGCKMLNESTNCSYSGPRSPNPDSDLLDSAASINNRAKYSNQLVINILNHVSEILHCDIFADCGLKGNKLDVAKEALLNAELVLHNSVISGAVVGKGCPIKHLLLHELETLASLLWMHFGNSLGIEDGKETNQLQKIVLDSIIEYLDERFGKYIEGGSRVSRKLPLRMNTNTLIFEIVEVVRGWDELSRYSNNLDELIEREMGFSLRDWTECETEAFETGVEISGNVLQILVDEIVMDLWKCGG